MADDLGYGELGCYGQSIIKTPNIDRLANDGLRFTQAYCGTSVCAPSRCCMLTGRDSGHSQIRGNKEVEPEGQHPLKAETLTVARHLQAAKYRTACIGKWGLGGVDTSGDPLNQGFDYFFGYNCQRQAHHYYPPSLWKNRERIPLDGKTYSPDLLIADAERFISENRDNPFFLFFTSALPHSRYEIPDVGAYKDTPLNPLERIYAAMITRLDADCGRLLKALEDANLLQDTIVIFTSDNGPALSLPQFKSSGGLRGIKRSLYEGGIRVPLIVNGPNVKSGTSDFPCTFWDFFPTLCDCLCLPFPKDQPTEGISFAPLLTNPGNTLSGRSLYWELHEHGGFKQAYREDDWKLIRPDRNAPFELYHLGEDPFEKRNLADASQEKLSYLTEKILSARIDDPVWPL